ncbi:hypothetical protein HPB50_026585 [Hyalomma asiaticum]|uniref:Uncharacterized protein n=1 Tax=Hyalomma asiaticum TaxID=266040 RepID=A0ACB7T2G5_HYAAI|nr:hypothetical protein HPB50_026585 [Hyalomma asiaticum]
MHPASERSKPDFPAADHALEESPLGRLTSVRAGRQFARVHVCTVAGGGRGRTWHVEGKESTRNSAVRRPEKRRGRRTHPGRAPPAALPEGMRGGHAGAGGFLCGLPDLIGGKALQSPVYASSYCVRVDVICLLTCECSQFMKWREAKPVKEAPVPRPDAGSLIRPPAEKEDEEDVRKGMGRPERERACSKHQHPSDRDGPRLLLRNRYSRRRPASKTHGGCKGTQNPEDQEEYRARIYSLSSPRAAAAAASACTFSLARGRPCLSLYAGPPSSQGP